MEDLSEILREGFRLSAAALETARSESGKTFNSIQKRANPHIFLAHFLKSGIVTFDLRIQSVNLLE